MNFIDQLDGYLQYLSQNIGRNLFKLSIQVIASLKRLKAKIHFFFNILCKIALESKIAFQ